MILIIMGTTEQEGIAELFGTIRFNLEPHNI